MARIAAAVILLAALFANAETSNADDLGTAGRFRSFGAKSCGAPIMAQMKGACDPPAVDENLPDKERAVAHLQRSIALVSYLRLEQARAEAEAAVKADPANIDALVFRIRLAISQMDPRTGERDVRNALQVAPENPFLLATHAEALLDSGEPDRALRQVTAALAKMPDDADMHFIKARTHVVQGKLNDAMAELDRTLALDPGERRALSFRAQIHLRRGEFEAAVADASSVINERPDSSSMETRAIAYIALGRDDEALDDMAMLLGKPGEASAASPMMTQYNQLMMQRVIMLVKHHRTQEAALDLDMIERAGGQRAMLRMQIYLRKNGFPDLPLDGKRSTSFDEALDVCFLNQACGRGLVQSL